MVVTGILITDMVITDIGTDTRSSLRFAQLAPTEAVSDICCRLVDAVITDVVANDMVITDLHTSAAPATKKGV